MTDDFLVVFFLEFWVNATTTLESHIQGVVFLTYAYIMRCVMFEGVVKVANTQLMARLIYDMQIQVIYFHCVCLVLNTIQTLFHFHESVKYEHHEYSVKLVFWDISEWNIWCFSWELDLPCLPPSALKQSFLQICLCFEQLVLRCVIIISTAKVSLSLWWNTKPKTYWPALHQIVRHSQQLPLKRERERQTAVSHTFTALIEMDGYRKYFRHIKRWWDVPLIIKRMR